MRLRYKIPLIVAGGGVVAIGTSLLILGVIGRSRGVSRVGLPSGSLIERLAGDADYADSYAATIPAGLFPDSRALDRFAFQRCDVAGETPGEIMYRGESAGLVYHVSYLRRQEGAESKLYVSTTVHYKNWRGPAYFTFVRPAHQQLAPFMVSVMIRQAAAAAE